MNYKGLSLEEIVPFLLTHHLKLVGFSNNAGHGKNNFHVPLTDSRTIQGQWSV
jgi:hypothetical protein